jgi:hypothetical protein
VIYVGRVKAPSGTIYEGKHDGLISEADFKRTQALLGANRSSGIRRQPVGGHLLRGRMATCAHCGRTLQARTEKGLGRYLCDTHKTWGAHACPMPPIPRELIDGAILSYFEGAVLDLEATRLQIEEAIDRKLGETRSLREHAGAEAVRAEERLARVRRDYQDGKLDAEDWAEQKAQLQGEREAAEAEAARLGQRHDEITQEAEALRAEERLQEALHDLRASIIGAVKDAEGMEAVRAELNRLFEGFIIGRLDRPWKCRIEGDFAYSAIEGGYQIVPIPRPEAITLEAGIPEVRRAALPAEEIATITSQNTSRPPRRSTMSSSFRPARAFASRTR